MLSELNIIDYFRKTLKPRSSLVIKGIGDDTAVIKAGPNKYLLATIDMLIEGKHFNLKSERCCKIPHPFWIRDDQQGKEDKIPAAQFEDVGYKALCCSISDIAAMGGKAQFALVSLGIPEKFNSSQIKSLYLGLNKAAKKFSVDIVGGDTNSSDKLIVDVAMWGESGTKKPVLRSGAKIGDYIFVTGSLGGSIYGRHLKFIPRVKESEFLIKHFNLHSMIDISDGLTLDLWRILKASNKGCAIFESLIPVHKDARSFDEALSMGEDFELLFTLSGKEGEKLVKMIQEKKLNFSLSFIGKITDEKEKILLIDKQNKPRYLKPQGFVHF